MAPSTPDGPETGRRQVGPGLVEHGVEELAPSWVGRAGPAALLPDELVGANRDVEVDAPGITTELHEAGRDEDEPEAFGRLPVEELDGGLVGRVDPVHEPDAEYSVVGRGDAGDVSDQLSEVAVFGHAVLVLDRHADGVAVVFSAHGCQDVESLASDVRLGGDELETLDVECLAEELEVVGEPRREVGGLATEDLTCFLPVHPHDVRVAEGSHLRNATC
ncbi:MAG: hypothetical protein U5K30_05760 [Acidimicrobiales bacterium]|nr:hypothetical protein [Acidimicrobiales bacterium]